MDYNYVYFSRLYTYVTVELIVRVVVSLHVVCM